MEGSFVCSFGFFVVVGFGCFPQNLELKGGRSRRKIMMNDKAVGQI